MAFSFRPSLSTNDSFARISSQGSVYPLGYEGPAQASAGNSRPRYFDNRFNYKFLPVPLVRFEGSAIDFGWALAPSGSVNVDS